MVKKKELKSPHKDVRALARDSHMASGTVKVRLVGGLRGVRGLHRLSVKALGLNRTNDVRELKDSPQVRGLIHKVNYLVRVED